MCRPFFLTRSGADKGAKASLALPPRDDEARRNLLTDLTNLKWRGQAAVNSPAYT